MPRRSESSGCPHEPVYGKANVWITGSGKKYYRCRFCGRIIEILDYHSTRIVRRPRMVLNPPDPHAKKEVPR